MHKILGSIHHRLRNTCCNMLADNKRRRRDHGKTSTTIKSRTHRISIKTERHNKIAVFTKTSGALIQIPTLHISTRIEHHTNNNKGRMVETLDIVAGGVVNPIIITSSTSTKGKINTSTARCWRILGPS